MATGFVKFGQDQGRGRSEKHKINNNIFLFTQMNSFACNQFPPILVYYHFRGQGQPLRNLLCYLQVPFFEVFPDRLENQQQFMPYPLLQYLAKMKIDKSQLPALIHDGHIYYEQLIIATYLCRRFNGDHLLGRNIFQKARLQQFLGIYFKSQPESMRKLLKNLQFSAQHSPEQINEHQKEAYEDGLDTSKYIREFSQYLDRQEQPNCLLGEITLIDFFYLQSCFYMLNFFDNPQRIYIQRLLKWLEGKPQVTEKPNVYYLKVMREYFQRMKTQAFYVSNQEYLESFTVISAFFGPERAQGLRNVWLGDLKFIQ